MATNTIPQPPVAQLFIVCALAVAGFYALVLASAYVPFLLPGSASLALALWGLVLLGAGASAVVGAAVGLLQRALVREPSRILSVVVWGFPVAAYLALAVAARQSEMGHLWWTPLVEAGGYALGCLVAVKGAHASLR
jgi:hypothetical protein